MRAGCPEALYGEHGEPNTVGNCPYCGVHLGRPRRGGRTTRSLSDEELLEVDRRAHVDVWGHVDVPEEQDPLVYYDSGDDSWAYADSD